MFPAAQPCCLLLASPVGRWSWLTERTLRKPALLTDSTHITCCVCVCYLHRDSICKSADGNSMKLSVGQVPHFAPQNLGILAAIQSVPHLQLVYTHKSTKRHTGIFLCYRIVQIQKCLKPTLYYLRKPCVLWPIHEQINNVKKKNIGITSSFSQAS